MRGLLTIVGVLVFGLWVRLAAGAGTPVPPPAPPLPASPVAGFRELLAMDGVHRAEALARRPERQREVLAARLVEYDGLSVEQREARLLATDLYWHLQQLLPLSSGERGERVASAPEVLRPVLVERLALWDGLSAEDRALLLQQERALRYLAQVRVVVPPPLPGGTGSVAAGVRGSASPSRSVAVPVRSELGGWPGGVSATDRRRLVESWRRLFEAPPVAIQRQLATQPMSAAEREEMEKVLSRFRDLPASQRQTCLESFARLASLPAGERASFMKQAERWSALPAAERQAWREIVNRLPPLPPLKEKVTPPPMPAASVGVGVPLLTNSRSGR